VDFPEECRMRRNPEVCGGVRYAESAKKEALTGYTHKDSFGKDGISQQCYAVLHLHPTTKHLPEN